MSGRYTRKQLLELAAAAERGFDPLIFSDALGALTQITDVAFAEDRSLGDRGYAAPVRRVAPPAHGEAPIWPTCGVIACTLEPVGMLNAPVPADAGEQVLWRCFSRGQAGDVEDGLAARAPLPFLLVRGVALDEQGLLRGGRRVRGVAGRQRPRDELVLGERQHELVLGERQRQRERRRAGMKPPECRPTGQAGAPGWCRARCGTGRRARPPGPVRYVW
jgi:hypothetical protein